MRHVTVPEVEEPGRFFPDPVMVRVPRTRRLDDGYGEFWREDQERWERVHPICLDIIAALAEGKGFDDMVAGLPSYPEQNINPRSAARLARKYCWKLHQLGHVNIALEEPPPMFQGRYARTRELGRGGLGIAHLCRDLEAEGRNVVVKHPWGVKTKIQSGQRALAYEIELLDRLRHPAIPPLYDQFTVRGLLHLVRDFVDGDKVSKYHGKHTPDAALRRDIATQVANVLGYVHDEGYLFFDPSPDNWFRRDDGTIMVADLGAARPHEGGRRLLRGPSGTAGYVAPEVRLRGPDGKRWASIRSDVWSFGCLYYFLLVGQRPRRRWGAEEIQTSLDESGAASGIDERARAVVTACCAASPGDRPADMAEVRQLL